MTSIAHSAHGRQEELAVSMQGKLFALLFPYHSLSPSRLKRERTRVGEGPHGLNVRHHFLLSAKHILTPFLRTSVPQAPHHLLRRGRRWQGGRDPLETWPHSVSTALHLAGEDGRHHVEEEAITCQSHVVATHACALSPPSPHTGARAHRAQTHSTWRYMFM